MSLFGSLPEPSSKRVADIADLDDLEDEQPDKRARVDADELETYEQNAPQDEEHALNAAQPVDSLPRAEAAAGGSSDQVASALLRIAAHIAHPKKLVKASELLRKLLAQGGGAQPQHSGLVFAALRSAMVDSRRPADPLLAREYSRLFTAASKRPDLFDPGQRAQLDVYGLWAVLRVNLATTDDSFEFNRVLGKVKARIAELPECSGAGEEEADEALRTLGLAPALATAAASPAPTASEAEAAAVAERRDEAVVEAWTPAQVLAGQRAALLDCVLAGKEVYHRPWAAVSIDLLVEEARKQAARFAPCQRAALNDMAAFVAARRAARRLGPSAKEAARDSTSFERTAAEWGKATLSTRGKVGAGGDHKSEQWLG